MTLSFFDASVPVFIRMIDKLDAMLDRAADYAGERKFDSAVLVTSRLAPDMYPLSFQVQSATDRAKFFVARVTGRTAPSWADDETTLDELKSRLAKARAYLSAVEPKDIDGLEERAVALKMRGEDVEVAAADYLFNTVLPNFYFHATTAYAILRHNGVPLGKRDFVG